MNKHSQRLWRRWALLTGAVVLGAACPASPFTADSPTTPARRAPKLASVLPDGEARLAVGLAALDGGGDVAVYGDRSTYDTASIVKVDILAALLLKAQDEGRQLTEGEEAYAAEMIEHSDNESAWALWDVIGRADGLDSANKRLGLTSTKGGEGIHWGLTQTTAEDQLVLLRAMFSADSASASSGSAPKLSKASRAYIQKLMGRTEAEQAWGVSAASGSGWALKNGWLQRSTTGLWDINSIGRVTVDGRRYLVAVLSDGNASMEAGVSLVEKAAKAAVVAARRR